MTDDQLSVIKNSLIPKDFSGTPEELLNRVKDRAKAYHHLHKKHKNGKKVREYKNIMRELEKLGPSDLPKTAPEINNVPYQIDKYQQQDNNLPQINPFK